MVPKVNSGANVYGVLQYNRIKVEKAFYAPEQDKADEKKGE